MIYLGIDPKYCRDIKNGNLAFMVIGRRPRSEYEPKGPARLLNVSVRTANYEVVRWTAATSRSMYNEHLKNSFEL